METVEHRYFVLNKPYNMVSQFVSPDNVNLLSHLNFSFPPGTHAIGRLDNHSEGLLLLTTNKKMTSLLFDPKKQHRRDYIVRVRNKVDPAELEQFEKGISIPVSDGAEYITKSCKAVIVDKPAGLQDRPNEYREDIPHSWLLLSLYEGKYHQVRKMVAAIRHPCQRLIRVAIEDLTLGDLAPGMVRELVADEISRQLHIDLSR
jgi:23S rRNA pseudouridine2457 synthase